MVDRTSRNVFRVEERAHRLARLDGIETGAKVAGTLMSPIAFKVHLHVRFQCAFTDCDFVTFLSKKVIVTYVCLRSVFRFKSVQKMPMFILSKLFLWARYIINKKPSFFTGEQHRSFQLNSEDKSDNWRLK
jgi:hypothetical protein